MARIIPITVGPNLGPTPPPPPPPLNAPTLTATVISSTQINLVGAYTSPPALATYTFQIATSAGGPWTTLVTQAGPNLNVGIGLSPSTKYYFQVNVQTAESPSRTSAWSAIQSATTAAPGIPVPTPTLTTAVISTTEIDLTAAYTGPPTLATYSFSISSVGLS